MCHKKGFHVIVGLILLSSVGDSHIISKIKPAKFHGAPIVKIIDKKAQIQFYLSKSTTRIKVRNCVKFTNLCLTENVTVPHQEEKRGKAKHVFLAEVTLIHPFVNMWTFYFWKYKDDILLNPKPTVVEVDTIPCHDKIAAVSFLSSFVFSIVVTVSLTLAIEGKNAAAKDKNRIRKIAPNVETVKTPLPKLAEVSSPADTNPCPSEEKHYLTSKFVSESLLSDGFCYQVWKGKLTDDRNGHQNVVIKTDKGCNDGYTRYLLKQGEELIKLRNNDYIIGCLGLAPDCKLLIMEEATMGNLKHYLRFRAEASRNLLNSPHFALNFINQIYQGVEAVHRLTPACLFYCLCASNVLLSGGLKCKLSGFSSASIVKHREEWEEKNRLPRPIQWLAPEAITLDHIQKSDIWSFGILMWEVFSDGKDPFGETSNDEIKQEILNGKKLLKPAKCSKKMYDVMLSCWMHEPCNRPLLQDISRILLNVQFC